MYNLCSWLRWWWFTLWHVINDLYAKLLLFVFGWDSSKTLVIIATETRPGQDFTSKIKARLRRDETGPFEQSERRPRQDQVEIFTQDRDETKSLGQYSLEIGMRPRVLPISVLIFWGCLHVKLSPVWLSSCEVIFLVMVFFWGGGMAHNASPN